MLLLIPKYCTVYETKEWKPGTGDREEKETGNTKEREGKTGSCSKERNQFWSAKGELGKGKDGTIAYRMAMHKERQVLSL